ncbi:MAG: 2-C-methyl-D-erythritol 4-phosphate cytidylyltransferase [Candidatus Arsenophonus melophagi]|nr:2-C-methyl-D-erythritol 4-phosphate cytidylyltransferase [Candidatus Arsenophonus melophagi]
MSKYILNHKIHIVALIPAAGVGSRMNAVFPKQYLQVAGKTIIEHSISTLLKHPRILKIIVLLKKDDSCFQQLNIAQNPKITTVTGGYKRADSVLAGLNYLSNTLQQDLFWVLVHDAARPCLHQADLDSIIFFIDSQKSSYGGILALPVKDTMKRAIQGKIDISHTVERKELWHALTPQFFPLTLIKNCLTQALEQKAEITDDSSALEYCGYHPQLLEGKIDNIKVTQPDDLLLAEFYLSRAL